MALKSWRYLIECYEHTCLTTCTIPCRHAHAQKKMSFLPQAHLTFITFIQLRTTPNSTSSLFFWRNIATVLSFMFVHLHLLNNPRSRWSDHRKSIVRGTSSCSQMRRTRNGIEFARIETFIGIISYSVTSISVKQCKTGVMFFSPTLEWLTAEHWGDTTQSGNMSRICVCMRC